MVEKASDLLKQVSLGVDDTSRQVEGILSGKFDLVWAWQREICNDFIEPPRHRLWSRAELL
ncbi:MAG: hypothetical protein D3924_07365 [Candidatus Electrothrix sp. AR4]|nr:hypothetical protein [Candidatus Electrothrix sp. AR4]